VETSIASVSESVTPGRTIAEAKSCFLLKLRNLTTCPYLYSRRGSSSSRSLREAAGLRDLVHGSGFRLLAQYRRQREVIMETNETSTERQRALLVITRKLFFFTLTSLLLLFLFFFVLQANFERRTYISLIVFASGLIGGFVSIQQRLPKAGLKELNELSQSWTSILLIPLNGGIFAVVLHILFISGLLTGTFFPTYAVPNFEGNDPTRNFYLFLMHTFPASGQDIAKLVFWAFVAGFSERFVPQIIRRSTDSVPADTSTPESPKADP
jgi:hypothetical protein